MPNLRQEERLGAAVLVTAALLTFPAPAPAPLVAAGVVLLACAALAWSWTLLGGLTGYVSLGHGALAGLGGYGTAMLVTEAGLNSTTALFAAAALSGAVAVPLGLLLLRVRGAVFAIASLAVPLLLLIPFARSAVELPRPLAGPGHDRAFWYLFVALLAGALLARWLIGRSRFGLSLAAIREDEDKAEALGTPTRTYKMIVFVVSAVFTALAGGLYALWLGEVGPAFQGSVVAAGLLPPLVAALRPRSPGWTGAPVAGNPPGRRLEPIGGVR